jgi:hypothetical protein
MSVDPARNLPLALVDGEDRPAVELFAERAEAASGFVPSADEEIVLQAVCHSLDGMPLESRCCSTGVPQPERVGRRLVVRTSPCRPVEEATRGIAPYGRRSSGRGRLLGAEDRMSCGRPCWAQGPQQHARETRPPTRSPASIGLQPSTDRVGGHIRSRTMTPGKRAPSRSLP